ncbi:MAG: TonB-dependent receptor [Proteobacteria bacterium]|nr:TonB-dependent receptor [Pseudomonadota bacterium]
MSYNNAAAARRFGFMTTVSSVAMLAASFAAQAQTQQAQTEAPSIDEITVTGTRVVRDGYEAPTPVTVIGVEQIEQQPMQHISDFVMRLPAFAGAQSTTSGGNEISTGRQSQNNLNLRGLDVFRTLVLLDGNRFVSGDVNGAVNASDLPTPLISRVDVVTGGASAAYGSDAVAGVVNFVLDKEFTGIKTEVQGGITARGDDPSYKVSLTAGTPFAGGRGHFLFSGEHAWNKGIFGAGESRGSFWGYDVFHIVENPAWTTTSNVPRFLVRDKAATLLATPGGIITSGPLKGTLFDKGGRASGMYNYGPFTNAQFTAGGGDYQMSDATFYNQSLSNHVTRQAYFTRASYDLTDNVTAYANFIYTYSYGYARSKLDDQLGNLVIQRDNAFLDPQIAARMTTLGLTSFTMGSFLLDVPYIQTDNYRQLWTYMGGFEGKADAFGTEWNWKLHGQYGLARGDLSGRVLDLGRLRGLGGVATNALDSVRTASGQVVCRGNVDANPANDDPLCVPFNPFGYGVNSQAAVDYVKGRAQLYQANEQYFFASSINGEPFELWAGPVSLATGFEWRKEAVDMGDIAGYCPKCLTSSYTAGNYKGTRGSYKVAEGFIETVVPLAKDEQWARSLDFNGAVRFTDYSTSGFVTTWKVGLTYAPVDELRLRATRSRDIRAGNLGELYNFGGGGQSPGLVDPFRPLAGPVSYLNSTSGNPNLQPEKANQTNLGIVYQPSWFDGFSASLDYYSINIKGAIETPGEVVQRCFDSGGTSILCNAIQRNAPNPADPLYPTIGTLRIVNAQPENLAFLSQKGLDIEMSYTTQMDRFVSSWGGELSLRAVGTHIMESLRDDRRSGVLDSAGTNSSQGPLNWRWLFTANYTLDPINIAWTGRYMSSGRYGSSTSVYIECQAGSCPVSTAAFPTIDYNHIDSRFYHDLSLTYKFLQMDGGATASAYLNIMNLMDKEPPMVASSAYWYMNVNPQLYDAIGRRFYAGIRFRM